MTLEQDDWTLVKEFLSEPREIGLTRGLPFEASSNPNEDEVTIIPSQTGIERRIGRDEWERFVERFNQVEDSGFDPLRPGHYARVSFNSSYLVALVREAGLSQV